MSKVKVIEEECFEKGPLDSSALTLMDGWRGRARDYVNVRDVRWWCCARGWGVEEFEKLFPRWLAASSLARELHHHRPDMT